MYVCMCVYTCVYMYQRACMERPGVTSIVLLHQSQPSIFLRQHFSLNLPRGWRPACPSDPPVSTQSPSPVCKHAIQHGFLHGLHLSSKHLAHWANCQAPEYFIHISLLLSKKKHVCWQLLNTHHTSLKSSVKVLQALYYTDRTRADSNAGPLREHTE